MNRLTYLILIGLLGFLIVLNPFTNQYISFLKADTMVVDKKVDSLYLEIADRAKDYEIPAEDAKIDRVWKAIPGINGLKVDIDASYKKMKKSKVFDENKLVYTQIKPSVHLSDLTPSPIYKGHPEKPMVSFIINVAWGNEYLPDMLATLKKNNVSASFFLEGRWVQNNPELAKMIVSAGHEVGNHSYTHPDMKVISAQKSREEIRKTNEVIEATTEEKVSWFAPPSGSYRDQTVQIASEEKLGTVMWTVDTIDWQKPSPEQLLNRVLNKVDNGSMILMHPTASTEQALDRLIKGLKQKGLQISTVSKLLSEDRAIDNIKQNNNHDFGKNNNNDIN
ncbi:polysaccharide deacetylase family protein [Cytobacillus purgationiresistens]|uniref:Sporulation protein (Polysaccharide deacetylase family) n=1 Tax=Cytobacillus purgationiresistens TaxID=863449 RepID=A0ABU0AG04_9BACI|nr:polysaccharide deacetylase family protein [Cytobacillus purgationiresistens]MDQ0270178.1 putative sporulation protein (polysaccharide deacetylase family) [Cytobacillus purgationiresistens]